jgi:hypothetical protein
VLGVGAAKQPVAVLLLESLTMYVAAIASGTSTQASAAARGE